MALPTLHLSRPAIVHPSTAYDNEAVIARVRESFRGSPAEWEPIAQGIRYVFDKCNSKMRYMEPDQKLSPGEFASRAVADCLRENDMQASDIDLLVYGGIAREYFEPATAAEVAGRLGAKPLHVTDVTCACAGLLEALHTVTGYFAIHDELQTAVICAGELQRDWLSYDIQSVEELAVRAAGLTLGNAAAAFVITREPLAAGSARLVGIRQKTLADHWPICTAPVDGHFTSQSKELFELAVNVPDEIRALTADIGWSTEEVDHYAFHQPSEAVLENVFSALDARPQACIHTHSMFGNTASTAWAIALDHRLRNGTVEAGDKMVFASAAAGFTIASAAAVWIG